jgi:hypothetical protein
MKTGLVSRRVSWLAGFIAFANVLALAPGARADVGDKGAVTISADRLFGFNQLRVTQSTNNTSSTRTQNVFSLLIPGITSFFASPRLAVDFAVVDHVTVGGAIGFVVVGGSGTTTVAGFTTDSGGGSGTGFVLAPRAGFILPVGSATRVWLRGGFTYFHSSSKADGSDNESSLNGFALNLEPTLVFGLASHVGLTVGGVIDLPLSGETTTTIGSASVSRDTKFRNLGIVAGLALTL